MKRPMVLLLNLSGSTSKMGNLSSLTRATPGDYLASRKRKRMGQRDLLVSMTMDKDFPGKVTYGRHAVKMEKPKNVLRSKTTNRHTAFKCTIRGDC